MPTIAPTPVPTIGNNAAPAIQPLMPPAQNPATLARPRMAGNQDCDVCIVITTSRLSRR